MRRIDGVTGVRLAGSGVALPSEVGIGGPLSAREVYRRVLGPDADDELARRGWDPERVADAWGVAGREWVDDDLDEPAAGVRLAAGAVERALDDAGVDAAEVDLLVAATSSPDRISAVMAAAVGKRLGVTGGCIDVRAGGAGGLDGLVASTRMLSTGCSTAVVVAAEVTSRLVGGHDPSTAAIYGDGAGALVLRREPGATGGLLVGLAGRVDADGTPFTVPGRLPPVADDIAAGRYAFQRPDATYLAALAQTWGTACAELRAAISDAGESIDVAVPYAVTSGQVRDAAAALGVPDERTVHTLATHGCLGAAGPLVGLHEARARGLAGPGVVVASIAVAGGVTIGGLGWQI